MPNSQQAIISTINGIVYWHICVSLDIDDLTCNFSNVAETSTELSYSQPKSKMLFLHLVADTKAMLSCHGHKHAVIE